MYADLPAGFRLEDEFSDIPAGFSAVPPSSGVTIAPKGGTPYEGKPELSLAGAGGQALDNLVPSAKRFAGDIYQVVTNPVETAKTVAKVGAGAVEKLIPGEQSHEPYADAVGRFYADRYGGWGNIKNTIATDPVGFAADASLPFTGGSLALGRAGGVAGQIGRASGAVSNAIDPIAATIAGAKAVGKGVGNVASSVLGTTTGVGGQAIRTAAKAGYVGGEAGEALRANMRGAAPLEDVVTDAKAALSEVKAERGRAYRAGMADIKGDAKQLNFAGIEQALQKVTVDTKFKGQVINEAANAAIQKLAVMLDDWKKLDPATFHTAEGFDALKKKIGGVLESIPYEQKTARMVAEKLYNVVKDQIVKQAPTYAKTMKNYEEASTLIREMEKTLSLNPKASVDTTLRKLQSVMRNNVNTNWGKRVDLVKILQDHGATHILEKLAGQALNNPAPRGIAGGAGAVGALAQAGTGIMTMNPLALGGLALQGVAQSPRVIGEVAHFGGRVANPLSRIPVRNALQAGYSVRGTRP